jgi:hypothetical protein
MPPVVFNTITVMFDDHHSVRGLDFRRSIFLFLTNAAGADHLTEYVFQLLIGKRFIHQKHSK